MTVDTYGSDRLWLSPSIPHIVWKTQDEKAQACPPCSTHSSATPLTSQETFTGSSSKIRGLNCSTLLSLLLSLHMSIFFLLFQFKAPGRNWTNCLPVRQQVLVWFFWGSVKALLLKSDEEFLPLKSRLKGTSAKQRDGRQHGKVKEAACNFNSRICEAMKAFTHCHIAGRQVTL